MTLPTPAQLADRMKSEILKDVKSAKVPATVSSFSELHDYVDANCYGGTEKLLEDMSAGIAVNDDEGAEQALNSLNLLCNPAMDLVDAWIKAGGIGRDMPWEMTYYPELTDAENEEIRAARRAGFAAHYPCFPSAQAQSDNTLNGARQFMRDIVTFNAMESARRNKL